MNTRDEVFMKKISKLEKTCQFCKKIYIDKNYNKLKKYCSKKCYGEEKTKKALISKECEFCKNKFQSNRKSRRFCSTSCSYKGVVRRIATDPSLIFFRNLLYF